VNVKKSVTFGRDSRSFRLVAASDTAQDAHFEVFRTQWRIFFALAALF